MPAGWLLRPCRHGYLRALPPREYLPLFWSDDQLALLAGTELEAKVQADRYALVIVDCEGEAVSELPASHAAHPSLGWSPGDAA